MEKERKPANFICYWSATCLSTGQKPPFQHVRIARVAVLDASTVAVVASEVAIQIHQLAWAPEFPSITKGLPHKLTNKREYTIYTWLCGWNGGRTCLPLSHGKLCGSKKESSLPTDHVSKAKWVWESAVILMLLASWVPPHPNNTDSDLWIRGWYMLIQQKLKDTRMIRSSCFH